MKMALQQAGGGVRARERVKERVRDKRSAPLLRRSGTRCRMRWEVERPFRFLNITKLFCDSDELCVFQQIGWLDESFEFDNATAMADIATLPQEVNTAS